MTKMYEMTLAEATKNLDVAIGKLAVGRESHGAFLSQEECEVMVRWIEAAGLIDAKPD